MVILDHKVVQQVLCELIHVLYKLRYAFVEQLRDIKLQPNCYLIVILLI